jgi:hypothetical protein
MRYKYNVIVENAKKQAQNNICGHFEITGYNLRTNDFFDLQ